MVLVSCEVMLLGFCYTWHLNESYTFDLTLGQGGGYFMHVFKNHAWMTWRPHPLPQGAHLWDQAAIG